MKWAAAARKFNVPATTLFDHNSGKHPKIGAGRPTILSPAEEHGITVNLQVLQETGFGLTNNLVGVVICDYIRTPLADPAPSTVKCSLPLPPMVSCTDLSPRLAMIFRHTCAVQNPVTCPGIPC